MSGLIIGFAGQFASGKTTLCKEMAKILECKHTSFGDHVREVAARKGLDNSKREILQSVGEELERQGWEEFCRAVLQRGDWKSGSIVLIDGIRHIEALRTLRDIVRPDRVVLIYVSVNNDVRNERLIQRGITDQEALKEQETHSTEVQVPTLKQLADIVVDGNQPIEVAARDIVKGLEKY